MAEKSLQELKLEAAKTSLEPARAAVDFVFDSLVNVTEHSKIPESLFCQQFLPFFRGDVKPVKEDNLINTWIGIAGTGMSEVDVVDDKTGEKLYTVPALYDTNILNLSSRSAEDSIYKSVTVYNAESNNIPAIATSNLIKALGKRSEKLLTGKPTGRTEQRWNEIFDRYDTNPKKKSQALQRNSVQPPNDDDVEYD